MPSRWKRCSRTSPAPTSWSRASAPARSSATASRPTGLPRRTRRSASCASPTSASTARTSACPPASSSCRRWAGGCRRTACPGPTRCRSAAGCPSTRSARSPRAPALTVAPRSPSGWHERDRRPVDDGVPARHTAVPDAVRGDARRARVTPARGALLPAPGDRALSRRMGRHQRAHGPALAGRMRNARRRRVEWPPAGPRRRRSRARRLLRARAAVARRARRTGDRRDQPGVPDPGRAGRGRPHAARLRAVPRPPVFRRGPRHRRHRARRPRTA